MNRFKLLLSILVVVFEAPLFPCNFRVKHELKPGPSWHGKDLAVYQTCRNNQEYETKKYAKELNPLTVLPQGIQDTIVGMVVADKCIAVDCPWWENQGVNNSYDLEGLLNDTLKFRDRDTGSSRFLCLVDSKRYVGHGMCSNERTLWDLNNRDDSIRVNVTDGTYSGSFCIGLFNEGTNFSLDSQCKFYVLSNQEKVFICPLKRKEDSKVEAFFTNFFTKVDPFGLVAKDEAAKAEIYFNRIVYGNPLTLPIKYVGLIDKVCIAPDGSKIFVKFTDGVQEVFSVKAQGKAFEVKRLYNSKMSLKDYLTCKGICKN